MYTDLSVGGSLKVGIYHFNWQEAANIALDTGVSATTREVYMDEIRQYTGSNGYNIVSRN